MKQNKPQIPSLLPGFLFLLIISGCAVSLGWGSGWSSSWTHVGNGGSITITRNNESVRAKVVGDEVHVVVLREGNLYGVDGLSSAQRKDLRGIKRGGRVMVDDPKLEQWQGQLDRIGELVENPNTTARQMADASRGLPFRGLVDGAIRSWVDQKPERAADILDIIGEFKPGKGTQRELLTLAGSAKGVDDDRITAWLQSNSIRDDSKSLIALTKCKNLGKKGAEQILLCVDEVSGSSNRAHVFRSVGKILVSDPAHARILIKQIDELYSSSRANAALSLLDHPEACVEFAIQVLENIDEFYGSHRLRIFLAAGKKALRDPRTPRLLSTQLDELNGSDRYRAAVAVLDWDGSSNKVALGIIDEIDEIYGSSRKRLINRVIDGKFFQDAQVQRAILRAVKSELHGRTRRKALTKMLAEDRLDPQVKKLVLRAIEDD